MLEELMNISKCSEINPWQFMDRLWIDFVQYYMVGVNGLILFVDVVSIIILFFFFFSIY